MSRPDKAQAPDPDATAAREWRNNRNAELEQAIRERNEQVVAYNKSQKDRRKRLADRKRKTDETKARKAAERVKHRVAEGGKDDRMKDEMSHAIKSAHQSEWSVPGAGLNKEWDAGKATFEQISREHREHNRRLKAEEKAAAAARAAARAAKATAAEAATAAARAKVAADLHRRALAGDRSGYNYTPEQEAIIAALGAAKPDAVSTDLINIDCGHKYCPEISHYYNKAEEREYTDQYHTKDGFVECSAAAGVTEKKAAAIWDANVAQMNDLTKAMFGEKLKKKKAVAHAIKAAHKKAGARPPGAGRNVRKTPKKPRQTVFGVDPSVPEWAGGVISEAREEMEDHAAGRKRYEKAILSGAYKGKESMYGHTLPGHGSSRKSCGMGHQRGCLNGVNHPSGKGKAMVVVHGCNQAECSKCFPRWITMTAAGVVNRLRAFHKLYQSDPTISPGRLVKSGYVPFVLSWHPAMVERMQDPVVYREQIARATDMINQSGLRGSALIEHADRFFLKPYDPYFSCHVHGVGLGRTEKEKIQQLHKYGRLVDPMSEGEPRPLPVEERIVLHVFNDKVTHSVGYMYNHIAYLLSHVGLRRVPGKDVNAPAVRYVGDVSNRKAHVITVESNYAGSRSDLARKMEKIIGTRRKILNIHRMVDENEVPFFAPRMVWRLRGMWAQSVASPGMMEENLDSGYGYGRPGADGKAPERLDQGYSLVASMTAAEARIAVWHGNLWTRAGFEGLIDGNAPKANNMRRGDGMEGGGAVVVGDDPNQGVDDPNLGGYKEHNVVVCKVTHEMDVEDAAVLLGEWEAWSLCARMIRDQKAVDAKWIRYRAESLTGNHPEMMDRAAYVRHYERYTIQKLGRRRLPMWMGVMNRMMKIVWIKESYVVINVDPDQKMLCAWCHDHYYPIVHETGTYPAECSDECNVEQEIDATQWWRWDPRYVGDPRLPYLAIEKVNQSTKPGECKMVLCVVRPKAGHGAPVLYDEGIEVKPMDLVEYTERTRTRITHMYRRSVAKWAASHYSRMHKDGVPGVGDKPPEHLCVEVQKWRLNRRRMVAARRRRVQDIAYRYFVTTGAVDGTWDVADVMHTVDAEVQRLGLGELQK